jgi:hypothetical protein
MIRVLLTLLLIWPSIGWAGLIFDNGTGSRDDTLVIQFAMLDSTGRKYIAAWDTAYVVQAYMGVDFNVDTLLTSTNYDISSVYPRNLMFEYRLLAGDGTASHLGAYTWWVLLVNTDGADDHEIRCGNYYVNDDPLDEFLALADTSNAGNLGKMIRDVAGDTARAYLDSSYTGYFGKTLRDATGDTTRAYLDSSYAGYFGKTIRDAVADTVHKAIGDSLDATNGKLYLAAGGLNGVTQSTGSVIVGNFDATAVGVMQAITDSLGKNNANFDSIGGTIAATQFETNVNPTVSQTQAIVDSLGKNNSNLDSLGGDLGASQLATNTITSDELAASALGKIASVARDTIQAHIDDGAGSDTTMVGFLRAGMGGTGSGISLGELGGFFDTTDVALTINNTPTISELAESLGTGTAIQDYLVSTIPGGFIRNPGFEIYLPGELGVDSTNIPVEWWDRVGECVFSRSIAHSGDWSYFMPSVTTSAWLKTQTWRLPPGDYFWHLYWSPYTGSVDTMIVDLQELGASTIKEWTVTTTGSSGLWYPTSGGFELSVEKEVYLQLYATNQDSFYVDDVYWAAQQLPVAGGLTLTQIDHYFDSTSVVIKDTVATGDSVLHFGNTPTMGEFAAEVADSVGATAVPESTIAQVSQIAFWVPDSLYNPDTLMARVDSIHWAVGMPVSVSGEKYPYTNLHKKLGPFYSSDIGSVHSWLDTLRMVLGWPGASIAWEKSNSIANQLGDYSGGAGDNNNVKDDIAAISAGSGQAFGDTLTKLFATAESLKASIGYDDGAPTDKKSLQAKMGDEWLISDPTVQQWFEDLNDDSTAGGGGGGLDAGDSTWLQSEFDALSVGSGTGSESCTLQVQVCSAFPSSCDWVSGARVEVFTIDQTTPRVNPMRTNGMGIVIANLDPESLVVVITAFMYDQLIDTIVVSGDDSWLFTISGVVIPTPSDTGLCNVYLYTWAVGGDTVRNATLTITPKVKGSQNWHNPDGVIMSLPSKVLKTDVNGRALAPVYKSYLITNSREGYATYDSLRYDFTLTTPNYVAKFENRLVPDTTVWRIR